MKTTISNKSGEALEIAKRLMYSIQVLAIGLFIPFSFVFGITYKRHNEQPLKTINVRNVSPLAVDQSTIDFSMISSDKNS